MALSGLYLVTAIIFGSYSQLRWDIALTLLFASHEPGPYRVGGVIELSAAAVCLTLGILLPDARADFVTVFVVLLPVGLARIGVQLWRGERPWFQFTSTATEW